MDASDRRRQSNLAEVEDFLASIDAADLTIQPGIGLGEELHLQSSTVTGTGLRHEGRLLHLAAFPVPSA